MEKCQFKILNFNIISSITKMIEVYSRFGLISDSIQRHLLCSTNLCNEIEKEFKEKEYKPDVSMYSFLCAVKNCSKRPDLQCFDGETQNKIRNFMFTNDDEEYFNIIANPLDPVTFICNGIFVFETEETFEDIVYTVDELLSDEEINNFCSFYNVWAEKRMDKITLIVSEQCKYFCRLKQLNVRWYIKGIDVINALAF